MIKCMKSLRCHLLLESVKYTFFPSWVTSRSFTKARRRPPTSFPVLTRDFTSPKSQKDDRESEIGLTNAYNVHFRHFKAELMDVYSSRHLFSFYTCDGIDLKQSQIGIGHEQGAVGSHTDPKGTSTRVLMFTRTFELKKETTSRLYDQLYAVPILDIWGPKQTCYL